VADAIGTVNGLVMVQRLTIRFVTSCKSFLRSVWHRKKGEYWRNMQHSKRAFAGKEEKIRALVPKGFSRREI